MKHVTFEQAKKLNELGIDYNKWFSLSDGKELPPTLHDACDWLREEKKLHVNVDIDNIEYSRKWQVVVQKIQENGYIDVFWVKNDPKFIEFHEAQSAGIDVAIEILQDSLQKKNGEKY